MITYIIGPNTFIAHQALTEILVGGQSPERYEAEKLQPAQLSELLQGQTLFASERIAVIKQLSSNTPVWKALESWIERIPEETHVVLIETHPDKRTKTHKLLMEHAVVIAADDLNESQAVDWAQQEAQRIGLKITLAETRLLVDRLGPDQWQLQYSLQNLALAGDSSKATIEAITVALPQANAFATLDAALTGKRDILQTLLRDLAVQEDPYRFFGLLSQQIFQLTLVSQAQQKTAESIAKDIGAHPYPIKKLQPLARRLSQSQVRDIAQELIRLDDQLKTSSGDPWVLIERTVHAIATHAA